MRPSWGVMSSRVQSRQQPAAARSLRQGLELLRARQKSIGLAERVFRNPVARQIDFVGMPLEERAASKQSAISIAAGAGQDDLTLGRGKDGLEIPSIGGATGSGSSSAVGMM